MKDGRDEIRWSPRVTRWKIRRLYESDAKGMLDKELVDDVGFALLLRCRDILTIDEAKRGRVRCPRCAKQRQYTIIARAPRTRKSDVRNEVLVCPKCGWQITWGQYALSYKRKQLNAGGATRAFEAYIRDYKAAQTPNERFLAIDRLIHEFHYSLRNQPDLPSRPVGVNLMSGKLADVLRCLDGLAYGPKSAVGLKKGWVKWQEELGTYRRRFMDRGESPENE